MTLDDLREELARLPAFGHALVKVEHGALGWCWTVAAVRHAGGVVFVQSGEAADSAQREEFQAYVHRQRDRRQEWTSS